MGIKWIGCPGITDSGHDSWGDLHEMWGYCRVSLATIIACMQPLDQCKVADIKMSVKYGSKFNAFNYLAKLKNIAVNLGRQCTQF